MKKHARSAPELKIADQVLVAGLRECRAHPSVSVMFTTMPGPILASADVVRLHQLLELAHRRLSAVAGDAGDAVMASLRAMAVAVRRSPTACGLALFASEVRAEALQLEVTVSEKVVVGPAFVTQGLLPALPYDSHVPAADQLQHFGISLDFTAS